MSIELQKTQRSLICSRSKTPISTTQRTLSKPKIIFMSPNTILQGKSLNTNLKFSIMGRAVKSNIKEKINSRPKSVPLVTRRSPKKQKIVTKNRTEQNKIKLLFKSELNSWINKSKEKNIEQNKRLFTYKDSSKKALKYLERRPLDLNMLKIADLLKAQQKIVYGTRPKTIPLKLQTNL